MTAIVGMTDLALAEEVSPTVHDHLQTARESADGLMEWLHELFHFSRLEAGRLELESVPFSLRRVVEHVTEAFRARAHEKGLKLVHDVPAQTPDRLQGDPARLGQVLVNLVRNAIDFTRRGRVTVAVREAALREEGSRIRGQVALQFSVADTGIGMAPEDRQRIFSPFLHSVGSTLGHIGGSGLGLGIARNLVELMGGRMWVESQPGQGSTFFFTVRLQRHLQDMPDAEEGEPSVSPMRFGEDLPPALGAARRTMTCDVTACAPESPAPPRMLRVLLADDAPTIRKLVAYVLGGRGHTVAMATDGREALDLLHQQDFDLVLMDVQMPEMDGFRATAEIRRMADRKKARVPIVAMTAHALHGDQQRCLAAGMDDYISKPMDSLELVQLVERLGASPPDVRVR
jgi:CheY-like chemotaxis protein